MSTQVEVIYENGVFRPLQPVHLPDKKHVTVTINEEPDPDGAAGIQVHFLLPPERWQAFCDALDAPAKDLPALRKLLTKPSLFDDDGTGIP